MVRKNEIPEECREPPAAKNPAIHITMFTDEAGRDYYGAIRLKNGRIA
jgi:hypothetical protein